MNYKHIIGLTTIGLIMSMSSQAQSEIDALTLAQSQSGTTALSMGMGGAGGSMGGDLNAISINPAGIGVYRKQELTITPIIKVNNVRSDVEDFRANKGSGGFYIGSTGLIITHKPKNNGWRNVNMGFTINTTNQYRAKELTQFENYSSSVTDIFADDAYYNGITQNRIPPYGFLGYQGYLIDNDYYSIVPVAQGLEQRKHTLYTGNTREYSFTLGGNYMEKVMLGVSANIVSTRYDRDMQYSEDDMSNNNDNNFRYLDLLESTYTDAIGFNAKFGAIFMPSRNFRLGLALHTPTWMAMDDFMDYKLTSHTENFKYDLGGSDTDPISVAQPDQPYSYTYTYRTPMKFVVSATALGSLGMLTADYEYSDYSTMKYRMSDDVAYENYINDKIANTFTATHTIRVGGELVLNRLFLRAGGAYSTSPYQSDLNLDGGERYDLTAGFGFRLNALVIDFGYRHSVNTRFQNMYNVNSNGVYNPLISSQYNTNYLSMTLGFKI